MVVFGSANVQIRTPAPLWNPATRGVCFRSWGLHWPCSPDDYFRWTCRPTGS